MILGKCQNTREGNKGLPCRICIPCWNLWHFISEREQYYFFEIPCFSLPLLSLESGHQLASRSPFSLLGIVSAKWAAFTASDKRRVASCWRGVWMDVGTRIPSVLVASSKPSFQCWLDRCDISFQVCCFAQGHETTSQSLQGTLVVSECLDLL